MISLGVGPYGHSHLIWNTPRCRSGSLSGRVTSMGWCLLIFYFFDLITHTFFPVIAILVSIREYFRDFSLWEFVLKIWNKLFQVVPGPRVVLVGDANFTMLVLNGDVLSASNAFGRLAILPVESNWHGEMVREGRVTALLLLCMAEQVACFFFIFSLCFFVLRVFVV